MIYVIMCTLYKWGGAEVQALSEFRYINEKTADTAFLLTFDPNLHTGEVKEKNHINLIGDYTLSSRRRNDMSFNRALYKKIVNELHKLHPDVVHLHAVTFAYTTVSSAVKKYKTVETIHDYSAVCDKATYVKPTGEVCTYTNWKNCKNCCYNDSVKSKLKITYRNYVNNRNKKSRLENIDYIVAPSQKLTDTLNAFGYKAVCINNAIDAEQFQDFQKRLPTADVPKKIVFLGALSERKGILQLLQAYQKTEYHGLELHVAGYVNSAEEKGKILREIRNSGAIYDGTIEHDSISKYLEDVFAIVIPSFWVENYPNVGLEGALAQCLVCGSDRGGIPEEIFDDNLIFDVRNQEDIKKCLHYLDEMPISLYQTICDKQIRHFEENNTQEIYMCKLNGLLGLQ